METLLKFWPIVVSTLALIAWLVRLEARGWHFKEVIMIVNADWKLPVYQVIGPIVRVHWDYSSYETDEDEPRTVWNAREAVVPLNADRATFVATINAEGGDGDALADGWFT